MTFERELKSFQNKLGTFDKWSLLQPTIERLHDAYRSSTDDWVRSGFIPWELLLFARLVLEHGGYGVPPRVKVARPEDFSKLINRLKHIQDLRVEEIVSGAMPVEGGTHPGQFLIRAMAFEQLPMQIHTLDNPFPLGRAVVMFVHGNYGKYDYTSAFQQEMGLSPREFMELFFVLWTCLLGRKWHGFDPKWTYAEHGYSVTQREAFIAALSKGWDEAGPWLKDPSRKVKNPFFRMSEASPLVRRPLLRRGDRVWCYSPALVTMGMETFIYDRLRERDGNQFAVAFGAVFERYIEDALSATGLSFEPERELKRKMPPQKVVDFVIRADDIIVMVEAKAVETPPLAQVKPDAKTWGQGLTSIIKAAVQFFEMARALATGTDQAPGIPPSRVYGLVVTYKETFIGPSLPAWSDFLSAEVLPKVTDGTSFLPRNLLFCSVHDFDRLLQVAGEDPVLFAKIIKQAATDNSEPTLQKQIFQQHLPSTTTQPIPARIDEPLRSFLDVIRSRIGISDKSKP